MDIATEHARERAEPDQFLTELRRRNWEPERNWGHWAGAAFIVGAMLAIAWISVDPTEKAPPPRPDEAAASSTREFPRAPVTASLRVSPEPIQRPTGVINVYECNETGQKILSDHPCGRGAVRRVVDARLVNTYTNIPMVTYGQGPSAAPRQSASPPQTIRQKSQKKICEDIQARIDWIDARMRKGYTSQEGEWLREEHRKAKEAFSEAGCINLK